MEDCLLLHQRHANGHAEAGTVGPDAAPSQQLTSASAIGSPAICELLEIDRNDKGAMVEIRGRIADYCTGIGISLDRNYGAFSANQMMELRAKVTKTQRITHVLMDALIQRICLDKEASAAACGSEYDSAAEEFGDEVEDIAARQGGTISSPVNVQERPSSQSPIQRSPPPQSADSDVEDSTNTGMAPAGREVASGRLPVLTEALSLLQESLQWYIALVNDAR
ncbi:hypothetical protein FN846DRAFT_889773 [Sphaerosporella brunnea]|uniref:Uncharacterized protein n=1 Tax=Sphaerosporella brunnea TaxID=1250544 RepID=A0A5J5EY64_9PEZI|nr:hypothetical protein FN846DRAFT_889773 [Sphaerosporella brunnea]